MAEAKQEILVAAFETRLGNRLPDDYRQFLLAGPMPRLEEAPTNPYVEILHSFTDLGDLAAEVKDRSEFLPGWFLPIGEAFGLTLGLSLSGEQRGRVFQWDADHDEATELAESFNAFLAKARSLAVQWEESQGK